MLIVGRGSGGPLVPVPEVENDDVEVECGEALMKASVAQAMRSLARCRIIVKRIDGRGQLRICITRHD
jgi:hypothetical protein